MMKLRRNWRLLIGCGLLMLVTAGCFQDIQDAESQNVVGQLNSPTPTDTPTPTEVLPPTEVPSETPTELDRPVSDIGGGTAVAQGLESTPDTASTDVWVLTATQIVAEITQTQAFALTQTQQALLGSFTLTPTLFPTDLLAPGITPSPTFVSAPPGTVCVHEVVAGENLFRLSLRYGVSVQDLAAASGVININQIWVGDKINIPGCGTTGVLPPPTSVPTPVSSAQTVPGSTTVDSSAQTVPPVATGGTTHVVQQYETLFQISMTYGVPVASIASANGITDINNIIMGKQLVIPSQ